MSNSSNTKPADAKLIKRVFLSYKPYLWLFILGALATFMMSGVDALLPYAIKLLIDKGVVQRDATVLYLLPYAVVVLTFARAVGSVGSRYCMSRVAQSVVMDFRHKIFAKSLRLPATFYDHFSTGHVLSVMLYNTSQIVQAGIDVLVNIMQDGSVTIGLFIVMLVTSWKLSLVLLLFGPPIAFVAVWSGRRMRKFSKRVQAGMGDITHIAEEGVKNYQTIRIYGGQDYENNRFEVVTRKNLSLQLKSVLIGALSSASIYIFFSVPLVILFALFSTVLKTVTAGTLISFITALVMIVKPLRRITSLNNQVQQGFAGAEGVFELLDEKDETDNGKDASVKFKGDIEFENINFSYPKTEQLVLKNISFDVKAGQTVALVGRSGSGKSTLVKLLAHFYSLLEGDIKIDGVSINDYSLHALRSQIAFVSQNITLFNDTVMKNIAYGDMERCSEEEVVEVLKAANAYEFVKNLPQGINTVIGENGVLLSGGQRQRIAIARAMLKHAPILILDEATSALDTETERLIQNALERLMSSCTSIVIAHRLSTIENADQIMVMDRGSIIERGNHESLMKENKYYAQLYRAQFSVDG